MTSQTCFLSKLSGFVIVVGLLLPSFGFADTRLVNCNAGDRIGEVLRTARPGDTLLVSGACVEGIEIADPLDGITLDGIYVKPKRKSKTALVWIHGLTSYFYSSQSLIRELSGQCSQRGVGYFKFNTRGYDLVVRGQKKHLLLGTLFEKFEDCVFDIKAIINFVQGLGYKDIILAGHSTGANKIVYYMYKIGDKRVIGLTLLGGLNDIVAESKRVGKKNFKKTVQLAKKLARKNPYTFFMSKGFLFTPRRYLSLHTPSTPEDVFPYYNSHATWKEFKNIRQPISVIIGSRDEYLDRPAKKLVEIFQSKAESTKSFSGIIIKGANHGFYKKEKELTHEIIKWVGRID